jgi:multicomponent Na+:H+ antiporter subunit B
MIETVINIALLTMLAATAIVIVRLRGLLTLIMLTGIYSFLSAALFAYLDAVDVAMTEAAVGAGITTVLLLLTLTQTGASEAAPERPRQRFVGLVVVVVTGAALIYATLDMPRFGDPQAPAQVHVAPRYLEQSGEEVGIPNAVTSVLASYRGWDTLGEVAVVFAAAIGVLLLLGVERHRRERATDEDGEP